MKIKNKLRTAAEFAISATMIATLLAACGGGGGGAAATTPTSTFNVTPGKGQMKGATVEIRDAAGVLLGSASTGTTGIAGVAIPATATGPFIVNVVCNTAACSYYDEKTSLFVSGATGTPNMQAVVPGVTANIGVTAATNAAAQYALNTGAALTSISINAANTTVATQLGLTGIDILTPPSMISDSISAASAVAGTSAADKLANLSAAFAKAASGVSAMQAIADYGNAWKNAAASGVIMPTSINTAALTAAASGIAIPTTTIASSVIATSVASAKMNASTTSVLGTASAPVTTSYHDFNYLQNVNGIPSSTGSIVDSGNVPGSVTYGGLTGAGITASFLSTGGGASYTWGTPITAAIGSNANAANLNVPVVAMICSPATQAGVTLTYTKSTDVLVAKNATQISSAAALAGITFGNLNEDCALKAGNTAVFDASGNATFTVGNTNIGTLSTIKLTAAQVNSTLAGTPIPVTGTNAAGATVTGSATFTAYKFTNMAGVVKYVMVEHGSPQATGLVQGYVSVWHQ